MSKKKIICVWIGTFELENEFYQDYMKFNYDKEDSISKFGIDIGLDFYDEDYIESWWFEKLEINHLMECQESLLDSNYFFGELITELKKRNLTNKNFISFLFGEIGTHPANEILFEYIGTKSTEKSIEFVFRKEYEIT
jgi:hypothetical protein